VRVRPDDGLLSSSLGHDYSLVNMGHFPAPTVARGPAL
jgi:hypothetical protein